MLTATAIEHYGTQAALARALNVTRSAINQWGEIVPQGAAYKLQALTEGVLKVDPENYGKSGRRLVAKRQEISAG